MRHAYWKMVLLFLWVGLAACSQQAGDRFRRAQTATPVLVFGDSLSAGLRVDPSQQWSTLLEHKLKSENIIRHDQEVANFSLSGETSVGGLQRLEAVLDQSQPKVMVLQLGANDALRRQSMEALRGNLQHMIDVAHSRGIRVILVGIKPPILFSFVGSARFSNVYSNLAKNNDVLFVPDLFNSLAVDNMQEDRLHPNASGQPLMMETVYPSVVEASRF